MGSSTTREKYTYYLAGVEGSTVLYSSDWPRNWTVPVLEKNKQLSTRSNVLSLSGLLRVEALADEQLKLHSQ
jgi:hypothetical protein